MGSPRTSWDGQGPPSPEVPGLGSGGTIHLPSFQAIGRLAVYSNLPQPIEDQWAREEGPWQGNWAGKFEADEGSEEEDDALSYYLSPGEVEQVWGQDYVDFGAI